MNVEHIEKLKREYTDKYVAVDASRPELARFKNVVGLVKSVNMSGRALVEFLDYHINIGWYDIDVDFLKVVDKPLPKAKETAKKETARPAAKAEKAAAPAGEKKLSPLEMARAMDAKKKAGGAASPAKPAVGGKMSTADVLAAARGGTAPAKAEKAPAKAEKAPAKEKPTADPSNMSTADILAAARSGAKTAAPPAEKTPAAPAPAKPAADRSKLSTADILAMARGEKFGGKSKETAAAPTADEGTQVDTSEFTRAEAVAIAKARGESVEEVQSAPASTLPESPAIEQRQSEETVSTDVTEGETLMPTSPEAAGEAAPSGEKVDRSTMSVDDMIAWCRQHDAS